MAAALVPLQNITLGSPQATVTFASIPGTFRDVRLIVNGATTAEGNIFIQLNSDTGSNYYLVNMRASGGGAQSTAGTSTRIQSNWSTGLQTSSRAVNTYDFMDYASSKQKTVLVRANHADEVDAISGRWANTAAITTIAIKANDSTTFTAGSTFALYGVLA